MAETVEIRIPVTLDDKTSAGISSINRKVTTLEKSFDKASRALNNLLGNHTVHLTASDTATPKIADVEGAASQLDNYTADIYLAASDAATDIIKDAMDAASDADGTEATTYLEADDAASSVIEEVSAAANELDGRTVSIIVDANNAADSALNSAASTARSGIAGAMAAAGVSLGAADAVQTFASFEAGMSQVAAISGATGAELDSLTEKAKYMGATTKFTATESSEAFNYMAMAGWKTGDMLDGIEGIMNLAAASGEDLGTTSDIVTDALTAFGLSASDSTHFADVLAQTASNANTNVSMMGESFKYVAPLAGAMNYSIEDVSQALGIMANAGVKSSMAGTSLRRIITNLVSPTDKEAAAMEKYGIRLTDNEGRTKSLMGIMENMRDSLSGLSEEEQTAAASAIFGKQALSGALAIINASDQDFQALSDSIANADGASARMADTMLDNLSGSITLMQSALEGVKISLGEGVAPSVRAFVDSITDNLPTAASIVEDFFTGFNDDIEKMKTSTEWQESDLFGKIDIAWDTLIVQPFSNWAQNDGASALSGVFGELIDAAVTLLPGGEQAGLTDWLEGGVLALAGLKIGEMATNVYTLGSNIGSFSWGSLSTGGVIAVGITAAAGAILALNLAIDAYNEKQIKTSLSDHFGEIELTNAESQAIADKVIDATWTVNVETVLGMVTEKTALWQDVQSALNGMNAIEYKAKVGVTLTEEDKGSYIQNMDTFVSDVTKALEGETYTAHLSVTTILGDTETGKTLASAIESWTLSDEIEMSSLSSQLTSAVDEALSDGILSVDEQSHIAELQSKMQAILGKWGEYQSRAQWQVLQDRYGNLSGAELTGGSYEKLIEDMHIRRDSNNDQLDQLSQSFYETLAAMEGSGRLAELGMTYEGVAAEWSRAIQFEKDREDAAILGFQANTLNSAYGSEISGWQSSSAEGQGKALGTLGTYLTQDENGNLISNGDVLSAAENSLGNFTNYRADKGLSHLYEDYMLPDVDSMQSKIDSYIAEGKAVPQELYDSWMEGIQIGAAAGNQEAGWQMMANSIVESGDEALKTAAQDGMLGTELQEAMARAVAELGTGEEYSIDSVKASIEEMELTKDSADAFQNAVNNFVSGMGESGATFGAGEGGNVHVQLGNEDGAVEQFLSALNMTEEQVQQYMAGQTITLSPGVEFDLDSSKLAEALSIEGASLTGGTTTLEGGSVAMQYHLDPGSTIWSIAGSIAGEGADASTIANISDQILAANGWSGEDAQNLEPQDVYVPVNLILQPAEEGGEGGGGAADIRQEVQEETNEIFSEPMETPGSTNVTITQENNADEVRDGVGGDLGNTFSSSIPVSAHAVVTVSWELANGVNMLNSSNGASVPLSVSLAHSATGRFVDSPMLSWIGEDGPEFVIPVGADKRDRGLDLWMAAGEALGVGAFADGGAVDVSGTAPSWAEDAAGAYKSGSGGNSQPINVEVSMNPVININGQNVAEDRLIDMIKAHLSEISDSVAGELAAKLETIFKNMPTEVA